MINGIGYVAFEALLQEDRNNTQFTSPSQLDAIMREARAASSSTQCIDVDEEESAQAKKNEKSPEDNCFLISTGLVRLSLTKLAAIVDPLCCNACEPHSQTFVLVLVRSSLRIMCSPETMQVV